MNNMQFGSDLDEWIRCFSRKTLFSQIQPLLSHPFGLLLFKVMKRKYWPLVLWTTTFTFQWELIQVLRELKQSGDIFSISGLVQKPRAAGGRKMICTTMHSLPRKIYPSQLWRCFTGNVFTNGTEFPTRDWQGELRLNWIGIQNWRPVGQITFYQLWIHDQSNILIELSSRQSNGISNSFWGFFLSFSRQCISPLYFPCNRFHIPFSQTFSAAEFLISSSQKVFFSQWVFPEWVSTLTPFLWSPSRKGEGEYLKWRISEKFWDFVDEKRKSPLEGKPFGWFMLPLGKSFVPLIWQIGDNPK